MRLSPAARRLTVAIPLLALAMTGCTTTASYVEKPPAAQTASSRPTTTPPTSAFTPAPVSWKPCAEEELEGLDCADVAVPLDYATPDGEKISVAISRRPHKTKESKGVILTNPGGPGGPGRSVPTGAENLPNKLGDNFDWIGIDIRGVGGSKPQVSCIPDYNAAPQPAFAPADEAATQKWIERVDGCAKACQKSAGFTVLQHMTTLDHARDLDSIRKALGVEKVHYWGTSYGTYLGQVFMAQYPDHVDEVVLDSVADPTKGWYQSNVSQNVAITGAFRIFTQWVAKNNAMFGLSTDAAAIEKRTYAKIDELAAKPPKNGPGSSELVGAMIKASYGVGYWPMSGQMLKAILTTGDLKALDEGKDAGASDNNYAAYLGVECSESTWPDAQTMIADTRRLAPANKLMTWSNTWMNAPCATWPVKSVPLTPVDGAKRTEPFLLINETFDPATPLAEALRVRERFPSSRIIVGKNGSTHASAFAAKPCVTDAIAAYLTGGEVPARAPGNAADKECEPVTALAAG